MAVAPTMPKDRFTGVEEALARLAQHGASDTPDAPPRAPASDKSADARTSQPFAAATLGPTDLSAQIPREQPSRGKRGNLAWVAITVCLGVSAIWGWRAYGGPARDMIATWVAPFGWTSALPSANQTPALQMTDPAPEQAAAPPAVETPAASAEAASQVGSQAESQVASISQPATTAANEPAAASTDRQRIDTMASDLAALRQTVDQLAALRQTVEQLAADQEQLTREIAKLQAEKPQADKPPAEKPDKHMPRRASTHPASHAAAASARKPPVMPAPPISPMPPQAAPQVSTVSPVSPQPQPAPQIPSEPQSSDPPPLRPPMPVPQR